MDATVTPARHVDETRIASGGMATVWRAFDRVLGDAVAVKRLHPHLVDDVRAVARFNREIEIAKSLDHPGIVTVLDAGHDAAGPFMVMELVEGETLRQLMDRRGSLSWTEARPIVGQLTEALEYAHSRGILHRDIKPANVVIDGENGRAVLVDFGVAVSDDFERRLTSEGAAIGTVDYLAPERGLGLPGSSASDVYALGAMLYEMLTGRCPFTGETAVEVALAHQRLAPTHPSRIAPVPKPIGDVIMRTLIKDPEDRIPTMKALDVATFEASQTVDQPTVEIRLPKPKGRWLSFFDRVIPFKIADPALR